MKFSLYIAKRYLFSKSSNNAINIITAIAAIGVIVGAMSLFIVLSGFSGLKDFSLQFSSIFDSELKVYPATGKTFTLSEKQQEQLQNSKEITSFSKVIEERVFLHFNGKNSISNIKGVDTNYQKVNQVDSTIIEGGWFESQNHVVVGAQISKVLNLGVFDYSNLLEIYVPVPGSGQITNPNKAFNKKNVLVSGIYFVNEELNSKYIFAPLDFAKQLLSMEPNEISYLELKLATGVSEEAVINQLHQVLGQDFIFKNRMQQNDALYKMLNTENLAVYLIFTLVLIIAIFNVIASIIMIILDKKRDIKTLKNLGASLREIRQIFYLQGVLMTLFGGFIGIILGVIIVLLQLKFNLVMITATLPYPIKLELFNVVLVFLTILVLGIVASKIASSRVKERLIF